MGRLSNWFAKSRDVLTLPEVQERLAKVERAVELQYIEKPQSDVDRALAAAAADLIKALDGTVAAAVQIGALLLVKVPDGQGRAGIFVRSLTQSELAILHEQPELLSSPSNLLQLLSERAAAIEKL